MVIRMRLIKELYEYRAMMGSLIKRDLVGRYKGSVLGFFWTFLNPLLQLCVYTVVFSRIMNQGISDYYLFLFVVLIPWLFFSTCISGGAGCVWANKEMVNKIYFPREFLPVSFVTSCLVNMLITFLVIFAVLILSGKGMNGIALLYLPLVILVEYILALGLTLIVSAVTVYLRDMEYILGIVMMAWQFLSPVLYDVSRVPDDMRFFFNLNPMTPILVAYREILYYKRVPQLSTLLQAAIFGVVMLVAGIVVFDKLKRHFAEEM